MLIEPTRRPALNSIWWIIVVVVVLPSVPDHHVRAGATVERARHQGERPARVRHHHLRPGGAGPALHHRRHRTIAQRRFDVAVPVGVRTRDGDEAVAWFEAPRVVAEAADLRVGWRCLEHLDALEEAA